MLVDRNWERNATNTHVADLYRLHLRTGDRLHHTGIISMEASPGRELVHVRMDLEALQEVTKLLQNENNRLRQMIHETSVEHVHQLRDVVDAKTHLETHVAELKVDLEHSRSERSRLESELVEAVSERRRQSQIVQDVRRQVDGRLSKLVEELHRRDEEVHKLEFQNRELERIVERARLTESANSGRDEEIRNLRAQLASLQSDASAAQQDAAALRTELRLTKERNAIPELHAQAIGAEAAAVLPLYRQWANFVEQNVLSIEDGLESLCDSVIDAEFFIQYGVENSSAAALPDRKRLAAMKRMDRERLNAHHQLMMQASANSDNDSTALTVQAIRASCDASRYTVGKCTSSIVQLKELMVSLHNRLTSNASNYAKGAQVSSVHSTFQAADASRVSAMHDAGLVENLRHEVQQQYHTSAKLRETITQKDERIAELTRGLVEAEAKCNVNDGVAKHAQRDADRKQSEIDSLKKLLATAESESNSMREEMVKLRAIQASERDASVVASRSSEARAAASIRQLHEESETKLREVQRELQDRVKSLEKEITELQRDVQERGIREERMRSVLEESREKRLTLKRQKDELLDEVQDLRSTIAMQSKDLKQASDLTSSVAMELERTKLALEVELQSQEESHVRSSADSTLFTQWKQQYRSQHPQAVGGSSGNTANSSRVVLVQGASRNRR
jgi:chromosome segregation ATPase